MGALVWDMSAAYREGPGTGGGGAGELAKFSEPVSVHDLDRICLLPHDGSRNWFVTMAYRDLARMVAAYTHALDRAPGAGEGEGAPGTLERYFVAEKRCRDARGWGGPRGHTVVAVSAAEDPDKPVFPTLPKAEVPPVAWAAGLAGSDHWRGPQRLTANFCHFAMWSSLTLGRDIRNTRLPHRFDELQSNNVRRHLTNLVIDARRTDRKRLSRILGLGQKVVLKDVGFSLVNLLRLGPRLKSALSAVDVADQQQTDALVASWETEMSPWLKPFVDDGRPRATSELRAKDLAYGLASYHLARLVAIAAWGEGDDDRRRELWRWVGEFVLRGTVLIASFEQQRVQQVLRFPIDDFPTTFFTERLGLERLDRDGGGRWRRRIDRRVRQELSSHVSDLWARFFTDQILAVRVGDEFLRLGRDLPFPPNAERFYPDDLAEPRDRWLQMLLRRYDHSYGDGHGTQARIWSNYDDRMNTIVNFMWSRAQEPGLWQEPFSALELRDLRDGKHPRMHDGSMD